MRVVEAGEIDKWDFRNFLWYFKLPHNLLIPIKFQFLFGFICLCLFQLVFTPIWHKSGTNISSKISFSP
jgi:hypothetical protein